MLSNNALQYGIGRMRSLELFQFNWVRVWKSEKLFLPCHILKVDQNVNFQNHNLSISTATESLNHLKRIVITDAYRYQPFQALAELKNMMPQVELE